MMDHLAVKLGDRTVGSLGRLAGNVFEFRFASSYLDMSRRPVLGQSFLDDPRRPYKTAGRLPPFFANLLPEGALHDLIVRHAEIQEPDDLSLLAYLGGDLPGAVVVEAAPGEMPETGDEPPSASYLNGDSPLKFSLAGVQLKFSALRKGKGVVLPVSGRGGDWILKLPDSRHSLVPANEFSILTWAQESGIEVPDVELIPIAGVEGLPREVGQLEEQQALLVRRYDRQDRRRIHQEDFAQVLKLYPGQKYIKYNYETIGRVVRAVAGDNAFLEYARRLAFMVLSGNGDAHHKNWSLTYPDDRTAALSPAYDLVFTRAYYPEDTLALNLDGNKDFRRVDREAFRRLARKCDFDEQRMASEIGEMAARIRAAWARLEADLPMHREAKEHLRHHLSGLQL